MTSFCSENYDKVHPVIMNAIIKANQNLAPSYGKDDETIKAKATLRRTTGRRDAEVFFCFNGTGANNFAISAVAEKYAAVYCSDISHLYLAESTATEALSGCRLYGVKSVLGKIDLGDLEMKIRSLHRLHAPLPGLISVTQPTECGTVYSKNELHMIALFCRKHHLMLHIDGARLFNALAFMQCSLREFISISRPDVLTLGGTKAGLMFGEAVLFFNPGKFRHLDVLHKRSTQLASKNRFVAVQYNAILKNERWRKMAGYSNRLAKYFENKLRAVDGNAIAYPVETNTIFVKMEKEVYARLIKTAGFYWWNEPAELARFTFSFSNTKDEIGRFMASYKKILHRAGKLI